MRIAFENPWRKMCFCIRKINFVNKYVENFGENTCGDITKIPVNTIPKQYINGFSKSGISIRKQKKWN